MRITFFCLLLLCSISSLHSLTYDVSIEGVANKAVLRVLQDNSQTFTLQEKEPPTIQALRRRIAHDLDSMKEAAHFCGYYGAAIQFTMDQEKNNKVKITFHVELGPLYKLEKYVLAPAQYQNTPSEIPSLDSLPEIFQKLARLNIKLSKGAYIKTQDIIEAENILTKTLIKLGYAKAQVAKKQLIANYKTGMLTVYFFIDTGYLNHFGPLIISGNKTVRSSYIEKKIAWKQGELFSPEKLENTQKNLEKSGLFSTIILRDRPDLAKTPNELPMQIELKENKFRSIGGGLSYTTSWGPGIMVEWEHRNIRGEGERLLFRSQYWKDFHTISAALTIPNLIFRQDCTWLAEAEKLNITAYKSTSENFSMIFVNRVNERKEYFWGQRVERMHAKNFEGDHVYYLYKIPLQLKLSNANNLLDPTKGTTIVTRLIPTLQFINKKSIYLQHITTLSHYLSFSKDACTIASKIVFGNIFGSGRRRIPPPDRFYGGSENALRGYKAQTISHLHEKKKPIGGRSMLVGSLELRNRFSSGLGSVLFYEIGNVFETNVPRLNRTFLHSVGCGARYATPIGPIRLDIAFPLNPRKKLDPKFQIYFSIGQSF